jgi:hypothetical protein
MCVAAVRDGSCLGLPPPRNVVNSDSILQDLGANDVLGSQRQDGLLSSGGQRTVDAADSARLDGCASPILRPVKNPLALASPVGTTKRCEPSSGRVLRSDRLGRRVETSCSRLLPCATNLASSLVRVGADRLLWLFLGWLWPQWREALVLIQPSTVDRWHRKGGHRCWRRRSRRPGRPRIDSLCRDLIRRIAAENCLWGAPRSHGELLKLGITISERTVSRYLCGRPTTRSQTWRTFFANHLGGQTLISPVMFADAHEEDIVVDPCDLPCRPAPSIDASRASIHRPSVDWWRPLQPSTVGARLGNNRLQDGTEACKSSGRDPAAAPPVAARLEASVPAFFRARRQCLRDRRQCEIKLPARAVPIAVLSLHSKNNRVVQRPRKADTSFSPRGVGDGICTAVGILANHRVMTRIHECH